MKTKTAETIAAAIGESVAFVLTAEAQAVEDEAGVCENCREHLNECMADIQTVVNDDSISLSTRLSYTIMQCAIALAGASHDTQSVSEIFEKLYISSRLTEAEVAAKRLVEMIFGDMGAGDPSDPRNN